MLKVAVHWLRRLAKRSITASIQYHADQDIEDLRRYWSSELAITPSAIAFQRKSNSGNLAGRNWRSRYGVLTVTVNDTLLRSRLQAWIDCVRQGWTNIAL